MPETAIWKRPATLEDLNRMTEGNMLGHLGIRFIEIGDDYLVATMPVDGRTQQPFGLLHGGASVALAESMGSVGSQLCLDSDQLFCVGLEINANHIRAVRSGQVKGVARPLHIGRRTQVWDIRIYDAQERLVCISRLTLAVLPYPE
ncbi:1,4-dihydroxy-2-naphthoyl-CoA hydrolase [bacterium HR18]|uniref:Hotdog fold thioesterase n=1 Tax=Rhodothermus marinus TaxID=29549 RepID=A0A7V2B0X6_RHOMR|nr:1,4-dihydroxy-2-naphthoyl-CoA hydrolase [bacterium HR18]